MPISNHLSRKKLLQVGLLTTVLLFSCVSFPKSYIADLAKTCPITNQETVTASEIEFSIFEYSKCCDVFGVDKVVAIAWQGEKTQKNKMLVTMIITRYMHHRHPSYSGFKLLEILHVMEKNVVVYELIKIQ